MENLRIGETAQRLEVSTATIRNWLTVGRGFFSDSATRKTGKRFTPQDLDQLTEIQRLLREGVPFRDLSDQLQPPPEVIEPEIAYEPSLDEDILQQPSALVSPDFFEFFDYTIQQITNAKNEQIEELKNDKERLEKQLAWERQPLWQKLFGKRPE